MSATIVRLPSIAPMIGACVLARWAKREGEAFAEGELIAELEADKALLEWRAPDRGVLLKQLVAEHDEVAGSIPIAVVGDPGDAPIGEAEAPLLYARLGPRAG